MPPIPRWLAVVWLAAGVLGLIAAVMVTSFGVSFIASGADSGLEALGVTRDLLGVAGDTAGTIDQLVDEAAEGLGTVESSVASGARTLSEVSGLAADLGDVVTSDIPDSLDSLRATMPQVIATAGVIDGVMRTLSFVGVDYDPSAPLDDSLRELDTRLAAIPEELRSQGEDFDNAAAGMADFAGSSVDIAQEIGAIRATLAGSQQIFADYEETVERGTAVLDELEARLERQVAFAKLITIVVGVALAIGQTVPIAAGWWAWSSGRESQAPRRES